MKRSVLIALAAFALAGCAKESVVDSALTNAGNAIGFNTYSNITRGNPFDNNPEFAASGNVFGVTAFISTSDSPYMGKADAGTEIVSDGTKWDYKNTSDIRYWPTQGETLSFYAYAPYTKNGVAIPVAYTKGDGMIMTDYTVPADDAGQVDLMYASALNVAKASPATEGPPLFCVSRGGARFRRRAASLSATCGSRAPGESNAQPEEAKQAEQKRPREQAPAIGKAPSKGGETAPQQTAGRQSGEHPASSAETLC